MNSPELVIFILAAVAFILIGYGFFKKSKQKGTVEKVQSDSPRKDIWKMPNEKLTICFEKKDGKYFI